MKLLPDEEQNMYSIDHEKNKISLYRINDIEVLSERLELLQITNETSSETNKQTDKEMSMEETPVVTNNKVQAVMSKNIVLDPGWFDRDKMKFEDW